MHAMHAVALAPMVSKILEKWLAHVINTIHLDIKAKNEGHWMTPSWALCSKGSQNCDSLTQCYGVREASKPRQEILSLTHSVWSMGHRLFTKLIDSFAHCNIAELHTKWGVCVATNFKRSGVPHAVRGILSFKRRTTGGVKLIRVCV